MVTPLILTAVYIVAAAYFLFRVLTADPFLPKPQPNGPRIPPLHLLCLTVLCLVPLFVGGGPAAAPVFTAAWLSCTAVMLRHAFSAPLFDDPARRPAVLHYPRLLLWRLDVSLFIVFSLIRYALVGSVTVSLVCATMALVVVSVTVVDAMLRLSAQMSPVTFRSVVSILVATGLPAQPVTHVPPTVYDAPAYVLLTFNWTSATVATGRRRALEQSDVMPMADRYASHVSSTDHFLPEWEKELARPAPAQPSVVRALIRAYGLRLMLSGFLKAINDACLFISPMLLRQVIQYIQTRTPENSSNTEGVFLAFALFGTYIIQIAVFNQYFNFNATVEVLVRGALVANVYRKSCRLSPHSRGQYTSGQIQNLMSNDSRAVAEVVLYIHMLWSSLEQVAVAMTLLIQLLGPAPALAGVFLLAVAIPLQSFLISTIRTLREKASGCTDERVKVVSEVIKGIKLVKLYAWELSFVKRILTLRAKELRELRKMVMFQAISGVTYTGIPTILTLIVFAVYVAMGNPLDASVVFPAITLFNVLRPAMVIFPFVLVTCARAAASLARLRRFLSAEELVPLSKGAHAVDQSLLSADDLDVLADEAAFSWNPSEPGPATLAGVSLSVPHGALVAVVGNTGAGKSTLLAGLLGEVPIVAGRAGIRDGRRIAFCDQIPFIQNATVRENILFGRPFMQDAYNRAVEVCCLAPDLAILPAGDLTELGGKGVNLSGGQRARVSLARAVYADADLCLLDDPLSAVDAHVAKSIFQNCIVGQLAEKTRFLATNQIHFAAAPQVDFVVVVKDGVVVEAGPRRTLVASPDSKFFELLASSGDLARQVSNEEEQDQAEEEQAGQEPDHGQQNGEFANDSDRVKDISNNPSSGNNAPNSVNATTINNETPLKTAQTTDYGAVEAGKGKLTKKEEKEKGRVRIKHYVTYLTAMGMQWAVPLFILAVLFNAFQLALNVWMSYWSDTDTEHTTSSTIYNLIVFFALGVGALVASAALQFCAAFGSVRASILLHEKLLLSVLGAPSSFFNANPDGRIINRFTSDLDKLDQSLVSALQALNRLVISLVFTIALIVFVMPPFIFVVIPITMFCVYVQEYYRRTSVDLRRLEALSRSPLYSHFSETLDGVVTLRAYGDIGRATHINNMHTDQLSRTMYATMYVNRWLSLRLEGLGTLLILAATLTAVLYPPGRISSGIAGLVLSYTMQILGVMTWCVRQFTETESQMSAMERVAEYSNPPFAQEEVGGLQAVLEDMQKRSARMSRTESHGMISKARMTQLNVSASVGRQRPRWPKKGVVEFRHVMMRYRADLAPALRDMSLKVRGGEHIGIVGRTGAGKSSAIQCLFRLYELSGGAILIDGSDISQMRLHELRSALGVIPQEPVCFSGTIRSNLDMFGEHDDADVQRALDACGLQDTMRDPVELDTEVLESGSNLSVGQRQLLCLGRALLKDSQVVILDEATSNVSNEVDEKIQQTLREEMAHCTILTVAHRLHTVIGSDRIVVMDKGRIAEVGAPHDLLQRSSMLSALVDETGPATAAHLRRLAAAAAEEKAGCVTTATVTDLDASAQTDGSTPVKQTMSDDSHNSMMMANGNGFDSTNGKEEDDDGSVRAVLSEAFGELRSALSKLDRLDVAEAMVDASTADRTWTSVARTLVNRLSVIGHDAAKGGMNLPIREVHNGTSADFVEGMMQNETTSMMNGNGMHEENGDDSVTEE